MQRAILVTGNGARTTIKSFEHEKPPGCEALPSLPSCLAAPYLSVRWRSVFGPKCEDPVITMGIDWIYLKEFELDRAGSTNESRVAGHPSSIPARAQLLGWRPTTNRQSMRKILFALRSD